MQLIIDRMDEHAPFRRVGFLDPKVPLDDTLKWLKDAVQGAEVNYTMTLAGEKVSASERQEEVEYSGCTMTVKITDTTYDTSGYRIVFDLSDIAPVGRPIKILADNGNVYWKIPLSTVDGRNVIQERSGLTNYTSFNVANPELAQRVVNAFNHATKLCRDIKRPAAHTSNTATPAEKPQADNTSDEKDAK